MKVCILGSGVMGSGIVSLFSLSSDVTDVFWWGRELASLESSYLSIKKDLRRHAKKNAIPSEDLNNLFSKIRFVTELSDLGGCDVYIEAIVEDFQAKATLLTNLADFIPKEAITATNTSSLSVTALAMRTNYPRNFIGVHFFNPTSIMKLVEVVKGLTTSDDMLERAVKLAKGLGKTPIIVKESPGFVVNRMLIPMINEAVTILAEGVASKEDIDKAMKSGANHPIGPLALADLIGNDVCLSIMESLHFETGDPKYRAHPLLRQYVRAGNLGRKTKVGFYEY